MNLYIYWYFIVYDLYKRFSSDKHFDIFATGLFSLFVGCSVVGIVGVILYFININIVLDAKGAVFIGMPVLITNYICFNRKESQLRLYEKFKESRSTKNDSLSLFMTLLSILLFVIAARLNMK
jgi:hypothetical protein